MRTLPPVLLGFALLVGQAGLSAFVPIYAWAPNLLIPIVIHLGVLNEIPLVRGSAASFLLGYLMDAFSGNPMGLQTFVLVATFVVARFAGLRLFMKGPVFEAILGFVVAALSGGTILALRAIFEKPAPFPVDNGWFLARAVLGSALATAALTPVLFGLMRRIDPIAVGKPDDKAALS